MAGLVGEVRDCGKDEAGVVGAFGGAIALAMGGWAGRRIDEGLDGC